MSFVAYLVLKPKTLELRAVEVSLGRVEQIVSATGRVEVANTADISFDKSGRISWLGVRVGDRVKAGQSLASLDSSELLAQKSNALASIQLAQARVDQIIAGPSFADLKVLQSNLDSANNILNEARSGSTIDVVRSSLNVAINALVYLSEVQYQYQDKNLDSVSYDLIYKRSNAMEHIYGIQNIGRTSPFYFTSLKPVLITKIDQILLSQNVSATDNLLEEVKLDLNLVKTAVDDGISVINLIGASDSDKVKLTTTKNNLLSQVAVITGQQQVLVGYINNVSSALAQLDLKRSPANQYDIEIAKAQLSQAQAGLALINAQLSKNTLVAPIGGMVSAVSIKRGETVSLNIPAVSILGNSNFEIISNISEADIAKVRVGNFANVYLDAFGQDVIWSAKVASIYPSEKMIEGVPTYETRLQFAANDERIRSGLTANLDIINEIKSYVLQIPTRAIYQKDGVKFVKIVVTNSNDFELLRYANLAVATKTSQTMVYEIPIEVGLKGSNGKTEVISGLLQGDMVVIQ
jgi:HlyD family secretion protein